MEIALITGIVALLTTPFIVLWCGFRLICNKEIIPTRLKEWIGLTSAQCWNRFAAWFFHTMHGIKKEKGDIYHLNECRHCREDFKAWLESDKKMRYSRLRLFNDSVK